MKARKSPEAPAGVDGPAFDGSTAPGERTSREGSGAYDLVFDDVRLGRHNGYDRIVLQFSGTGVPGYQVRYEDDPRQEGSGRRVRLDGDAALVITAERTIYPDDCSRYYDGPRRIEGPGDTVTEVSVGGTFEGYTDVYAGISGAPRPFRVFTLTGPPRLVVDVASGS